MQLLDGGEWKDEEAEALGRGDHLVFLRPQKVQLEQGGQRRQGRGEEGRQEVQGGLITVQGPDRETKILA